MHAYEVPSVYISMWMWTPSLTEHPQLTFGHPQLNWASMRPDRQPCMFPQPSWGTELGCLSWHNSSFPVVHASLMYTLHTSLRKAFGCTSKYFKNKTNPFHFLLPTTLFWAIIIFHLGDSNNLLTVSVLLPGPLELIFNRVTTVPSYKYMMDHVTPAHKPPMALCFPQCKCPGPSMAPMALCALSQAAPPVLALCDLTLISSSQTLSVGFSLSPPIRTHRPPSQGGLPGPPHSRLLWPCFASLCCHLPTPLRILLFTVFVTYGVYHIYCFFLHYNLKPTMAGIFVSFQGCEYPVPRTRPATQQADVLSFTYRVSPHITLWIGFAVKWSETTYNEASFTIN